MARLNIEHAQFHAGYDPETATHTAALFETLEDAYRLRREYVRLLRRVAGELEDQNSASQMLRLARKLSRREITPTLADPVHLRELRQRVGSDIWHFLDQPGVQATAQFITIVLRDAQYHGNAPIPYDPNRIKLTLRGGLDRCGARDADGFLILWFEGDHDTRNGIGQVNAHGFAGGAMTSVLHRLMQTPKYLSERAPSTRPRYQGNLGARVVDPITISTGLNRLPRPILYCLKQQWRTRPVVVGETGEWSPNAARGKRMPRVAEAYSLLWRDQWSLQEITLMMGMYVGNNGLALSI